MFDILWLNGKDLRSLALVRCKQIFQKLIPARDPRLLYVDYTYDGAKLYHLVCYLDLEGVVMKPKKSKYGESWLKVKNPAYSQIQDRHKLFNGKRAQQQ